MEMAVTHWTTVLKQCLLRRLSPTELLSLIQGEGEVDGRQLTKALLDCRQLLCIANDPLPSLYFDMLILSSRITILDALIVLVGKWNGPIIDPGLHKDHDTEVSTLQDINMLLMSSKLLPSESETLSCLNICSKWLTVLTKSINQKPSKNASSTSLLEAVGSLLATVSATPAGIQLLSYRKKHEDKSSNQFREAIMSTVRGAIEAIMTLFPAVSMQTIQRLEAVQKHISLFDIENNQQSSQQQTDLQAMQFQNGIVDTPIAASQAGTILYLEAMLLSSSCVEDTKVVEMLLLRHQNDYASAFHDLLLSSFELLKIGYIESSTLYRQQCITFIVNKLPIILSSILASSFGSFLSGELIATTWTRIQPQLLSEETLGAAHRFLFASAQNQLLSEEIVAQIISNQETMASIPQKILSKDDLVAQIFTSHSKITKLVEDLSRAEGNATFQSQAIVEIVHTYCQNKETHHLKDLANALLQNPTAINNLVMFTRPTFILSPLCTLLDEWRWDEIHGESQPVYDEFGSILLLVLAFQRRLGLDRSDFGIKDNNSFMIRYLDHEGNETSISELSEESQKHLGDWINALYIAEGLSDDLTSSCSPHEFYILVPTLLQQSVLAYQRGKLGSETLQNGLEYLLEPFLLPSLISSLCWVANHIDQDLETCELILQVFTKAPANNESQKIHQTILAMMAETLKHSVNSKGQDETVIKSLAAFENCDPFSFRLKRVENIHPGILQQGVMSRISMLINQEFSSIMSLLRDVTQLHGLDVALNELLMILPHFSGTREFGIALDLLCILICMASTSLRNILRLKFNRLGSLLKKNDVLGAEAIVHLYRRVEVYASVLLVPGVDADPFESLPLSNIDAPNVHMDVNNVTTELNDQQPIDDIDQVLDEAAAMGGMDQGDTGMSIDDLYGLQNDDNMGLGNLDDLDLDMFE